MAVSAVKKEPARKSAAAEAAPEPTPKGNRKYLFLLIIILSIGGLAGGGAYWYLSHNKGGQPAETKPQAVKAPVFVPLEQFTVNLQLEESPQFLQAGLSLKVADSAVVDSLKTYMPEVRDRVLLLLSSRKASELLTVDGKRKLGNDILQTINAILLPPAPATKAPPKAAREAPPPAEADADGEEKAAREAAPQPPAKVQPPVLNVLFTSFIIQ
jgi:flagellar protein FliL